MGIHPFIHQSISEIRRILNRAGTLGNLQFVLLKSSLLSLFHCTNVLYFNCVLATLIFSLRVGEHAR